MSNSASVSFKNGSMESVTLFDHWGGKQLAEEARKFVKELKASENFERFRGTPLGRLEPSIVMVNFLRVYSGDVQEHFLTNERNHIYIPSSLYLEKSPADGDNSDNGHTTIDLEKF